MVTRSLQPLIIVVVVLILIGLRLLPEYDPVARLIQSTFSWGDDNNSQQIISSEPIIVDLNNQIAELRSQLDFKNSTKANVISADVVNKTVVSYRRAIKLNRGSNDGILVDQPVFASGYMVGVIVSVEPQFSSMLLIGDPDIIIPVQIGNSHGVIKAQSGGIIIDEFSGTEPKTGDPVITSGIGGLYPPGLVIGSVGAKLESAIFQRFVLDQPIDIDSIRFVMVVL